MSKSRWEEEIGQAVLKEHLIGAEKIPQDKVYQEFPIEVKELPQSGIRAAISADFVVDRGDRYEVIECKDWNHPTFNIGPALGQALVYKQMMIMHDNYPAGGKKRVKLGLCLVDGFKSKYGQWTPAHDELVAALAKTMKQQITVYLIKPRKPEFAEEKYWYDSANYCVDPRTKIFK